MSRVGDWANEVSSRYRFADRRTPVESLPQTIDAEFYKQVPHIVIWLADQLYNRLADAQLLSQSGHDLKTGSRDTLIWLLSNSIGNFPFSDVQNAGGWRAVLKWILERPLFTWDETAPNVTQTITAGSRVESLPIPFQQRGPDAYSASPGLALAFLGYAPDATYALNPAGLDGRITQAYYHPEFGIVFNKYFVDSVAQALAGMVQRQIDGQAWREDKSWVLLQDYAFDAAPPYRFVGGYGTALICPPGIPSSSECQSLADFESNYHVEAWRAFPWITNAFHQPALIYSRLNEIAQMMREQRRKEDLMQALTGIARVMAVMGLAAAVQAVIANGLTLATSADLVIAADRLPGVDLGDAGKYLKIASGTLDLESFANETGIGSLDIAATGDAMDFGDFSFGDVDFGVDVPSFDFGDFGSDFGDFGFGDFGSDFGSIDLGNQWSGFDLGPLDVPSFDLNFDTLVEGTSSILGDFDLSGFVTGLGQLYLQYNAQQLAAERMGQVLPPSVIRPTPGYTRQLPDGSVAVTNADGSTTVRSPTGQVRTVMPTGQIVAGGPATEWIPGVPNVALLGGAALVGVLLLMRK